MAIFNNYLSTTIPLALKTTDRKRVAQQILTILKQTTPVVKLEKANCLDLGSSSGEVSSYLSENIGKIVCIDIDKNAIQIGKEKFTNIKNLSFTYFNGIDIPYPDHSFDLVILRRVIECAEKPQELMEEIFRVLKRSGLVYFESQNIIWPDPNWDYFAFVPAQIKKIFAKLTRKKAYYFATYRNYWQLKKLFFQFRIDIITPKILKNPKKYNFTKLSFIQPLTQLLPDSFFNLLEPLNRHFIWILKKP
ncbi:class I SAM-dependent methyltransferase [Candidatus Microgenomates bacterium]|nr:class I SAM-dependent methyltransferase [Candidatus Microgenomates bacterium]